MPTNREPPSSPARPSSFARRWRGPAAALAALAALVWGGWLLELDWRKLGHALTELNRPLLFLALAVLPAFGFPVSVTYFTAGVVFGPWVGGLVLGGATACHLLLTHALATTLLRAPIARWQARWLARLPTVPSGEKATLLAIIVIAPGPPYLVRNALMVLGEVPLRLRLALGVPLYVLRAGVTLMAGVLLQQPDLTAFLITGAVVVVKLTVGLLLFRRLRRHCLPAHAGGAHLTSR